MKKEVRLLKRTLGSDYPWVTTGAGSEATRQSLSQRFRSPAQRPGLLIFTGSAGQLDPSLSMGQVLLPKTWCFEEGGSFTCDVTLLEKLRLEKWPIDSLGITLGRPVLTSRQRLAVFQRSGAQICDMEGAAALETARHFGVPCLVPKVVADTAASGIDGFWDNLDTNLERLGVYLKGLLSHFGE